MAVYLYPRARDYLQEHGYTAARIDAMPVVQTVLLYWWKQFEVVRDDAFKWLLLPGDEVRSRLDQWNDDVRAAEMRGDGGVFTSSLPALSATVHAQIRNRAKLKCCGSWKRCECMRPNMAIGRKRWT